MPVLASNAAAFECQSTPSLCQIQVICVYVNTVLFIARRSMPATSIAYQKISRLGVVPSLFALLSRRSSLAPFLCQLSFVRNRRPSQPLTIAFSSSSSSLLSCADALTSSSSSL